MPKITWLHVYALLPNFHFTPSRNSSNRVEPTVTLLAQCRHLHFEGMHRRLFNFVSQSCPHCVLASTSTWKSQHTGAARYVGPVLDSVRSICCWISKTQRIQHSATVGWFSANFTRVPGLWPNSFFFHGPRARRQSAFPNNLYKYRHEHIHKGPHTLQDQQRHLLTQHHLCGCLITNDNLHCPNVPTTFSLVGDGFGTAYGYRSDADHLIATLRTLYELKINWIGSEYLGIMI